MSETLFERMAEVQKPWWDQAIRDHEAEHGPSGGAWNISMILERLHRTHPTPDEDKPLEEVVARALYHEAQLEAVEMGALKDVPDYDNDDEDSRRFCRAMARAAIGAYEQAQERS